MSNEDAATMPEAIKPDRKIELINGILIVLGFLGIAIAGCLAYAKMQNLLVPCTEGSHDCATVDNSEMSMLFGRVYVGYLGLAGYLILTGLSIARSFLAGKDWRTFTTVGMVFSGIGTLYSFFLTFYSISVLNATCIWCISSALTMATTFALHYVLSSKKTPEVVGRSPILPAAVGLVVTMGLFGGFVTKMKSDLDKSMGTVELPPGIEVEDIIPEPSRVRGGGPDAPVILVEFADFNCPACRGSYKAVHDAVEAAGPKLGYAFRNFPLYNLEGHETSLNAAFLSVYAADKGKYFDWIDAAFDPGNNANIKTISGLTIIAEQAKLDAAEVQTVLDDTHAKKEEYLDSVNQDMALARSLGALSTPTFIVIAKGHKTVVLPHTKLAELFSREPYKSLLQ